ncbi:MAG TPA: hypothetical protein VF483_02350 [Gemmatimonadaceae bacterium]
MSLIQVRLAALLFVAGIAVAPNHARAQKKTRDVITREEILKSAQANGDLMTAIKALRPHFLEAPRGTRSIGGSGMAPIAIYVDKIRQPDGDVLSQMMANSVAEVRYLDPSRSQNEYGITANGGAIVIRKYVPMSVADSLNKKPPQP